MVEKEQVNILLPKINKRLHWSFWSLFVPSLPHFHSKQKSGAFLPFVRGLVATTVPTCYLDKVPRRHSMNVKGQAMSSPLPPKYNIGYLAFLRVGFFHTKPIAVKILQNIDFCVLFNSQNTTGSCMRIKIDLGAMYLINVLQHLSHQASGKDPKKL